MRIIAIYDVSALKDQMVVFYDSNDIFKFIRIPHSSKIGESNIKKYIDRNGLYYSYDVNIENPKDFIYEKPYFMGDEDFSLESLIREWRLSKLLDDGVER